MQNSITQNLFKLLEDAGYVVVIVTPKDVKKTKMSRAALQAEITAYADTLINPEWEDSLIGEME